MSIGISGISNLNSAYCPQMIKGSENQEKENVTPSSNASNPQLSAKKKIKQADEFLAQHDKLYAEQQATVMKTITDGMVVAQKIATRMSSGAKVSQTDENNLRQYSITMYMAAKNSQMMAEQKKDMSDESLIDKFVEKHSNDRKDWTSELNQRIQNINQSQSTDANISQSVGTIDFSI